MTITFEILNVLNRIIIYILKYDDNIKCTKYIRQFIDIIEWKVSYEFTCRLEFELNVVLRIIK